MKILLSTSLAKFAHVSHFTLIVTLSTILGKKVLISYDVHSCSSSFTLISSLINLFSLFIAFFWWNEISYIP